MCIRDRFGVTEANVRQIQSGKTWRDGRKVGGMTDDQVRAIRADTRSEDVVATDYGISRSTVRRVRSRQSYGHVADAPMPLKTAE